MEAAHQQTFEDSYKYNAVYPCGELTSERAYVLQPDRERRYFVRISENEEREPVSVVKNNETSCAEEREPVSFVENEEASDGEERRPVSVRIKTTTHHDDYENVVSETGRHSHRKRDYCERERNTAFLHWTVKEICILVSRMRETLSKIANKSCTQATRKVNWDEVAFGPYSAKDCEAKFRFLLKRIGSVKTLSVVLSEMEDKAVSGQLNQYLIMLPRNMFAKRFIEENPGISPLKVFAEVSKAWKNLSQAEKDRYTNYYIESKKTLIQSDKPPALPKTSFELFYNARCQKKGRRGFEFKKLSRKKYCSLKQSKKIKYIKLASVELYSYEFEAAKYQEKHPDWIYPSRRGPNKEESEMYLLHLGMPRRPPSSAFRLFYHEKKNENQFDDVHENFRVYLAAEIFRNLPDDEKLVYRRKFKEVVDHYTVAYPAWRKQQTQVVQLLADKYLNKKKVIPVPLITLPLNKNSSPVIKKRLFKTLDKNVFSGSEENVSGSEKDMSPGSEENVYLDAKKKISPGLKENIYPCTNYNTHPCIKKKISFGIKTKMYPPTPEKLAYSGIEKNMQSEREITLHSHIEKKSPNISQKSESGRKFQKKQSVLADPQDDRKEILSTVALKKLFRLHFTPKAEDNLKSKLEKLKQLHKKSMELNPEQLPALDNCLKKLRRNFKVPIMEDVVEMNKAERKVFLATQRNMLKIFLKCDIFENIYPLNHYPPDTSPVLK